MVVTPVPDEPPLDDQESDAELHRVVQVGPESLLDEPPLDNDEPAVVAEGPTHPQMAKMHALFNKVGWPDREDRLRAVAAIIGRQVGSSKELTRAEASVVIDTLELVAAGPDPQGRLVDLVAEFAFGDVAEVFDIDRSGTGGAG